MFSAVDHREGRELRAKWEFPGERRGASPFIFFTLYHHHHPPLTVKQSWNARVSEHSHRSFTPPTTSATSIPSSSAFFYVHHRRPLNAELKRERRYHKPFHHRPPLLTITVHFQSSESSLKNSESTQNITITFVWSVLQLPAIVAELSFTPPNDNHCHHSTIIVLLPLFRSHLRPPLPVTTHTKRELDTAEDEFHKTRHCVSRMREILRG